MHVTMRQKYNLTNINKTSHAYKCHLSTNHAIRGNARDPLIYLRHGYPHLNIARYLLTCTPPGDNTRN